MRDDISDLGDLLLRKVDSLEEPEKCDTILLMSLYLMRWGATMLSETRGTDTVERYRTLANEMESLYRDVRQSDTPGSAKGPETENVISFPAR